jgi:hypothetical protein
MIKIFMGMTNHLIENFIKKYFQKQKEKKQSVEKLNKLVNILNNRFGKTYVFSTKDHSSHIVDAALEYLDDDNPGFENLLRGINFHAEYTLDFVAFENELYVKLDYADELIYNWKEDIMKNIHNDIMSLVSIDNFKVLIVPSNELYIYENNGGLCNVSILYW